MTGNKTLIYILFLSVFLTNKAYGQSANLNGDTIFVSAEEELQIKLPSDRIEYRWTSLNPPYLVSLAPNSLFVHAKNDSAKCSNLSIFEGPGPRSHNLVFCYQKQISKFLYDYSTIKKLQQRVREIEDRESKKIAAEKEPPSTPENSSSLNIPSYYRMLEDGDIALKNGQLEEAQSKYEQVLQVQPGNEFAKKGLENVKVKKSEVQRNKIALIKAEANKAFSEKKYDDALKGYNEAISFDPNDLFAKSQITNIKKIKAEETVRAQKEKDRLAQLEIDNKVEDLKKKATIAFEEKRYDDAIAAYTNALKLSPADARLIKSKIESIEKIKNQVEQQRQQDIENKNKNEKFKALMTDADKAFENKEYEVAKQGYLNAKELKPGDASVEKKLAITNEQIINKQKEDEYTTALSNADEAMKLENYEKAKTQYLKAAGIFNDRPYPKQRIADIDKIAADMLARQREEKERRERELETINKYNSAVEKADKALTDKDYPTAKAMYTQASSIKPDEEYPKSKLSEIEITLVNIEKEKKARADSVAMATEVNKKYTAAITRGKAALDRKDYKGAQLAYTEASLLKPLEYEPKIKLELIERQVNVSALNARYDSAVGKGNIALADRNLVLALQSFREALVIKPLETLPLNQIKYIQGQITADSLQQVESLRRAEVRVREEIRIKRFNEGMLEYSNYERAAQTADFEAEVIYLKKFLNIFPDNTELNNYQYIQKIDESKRKIQTIRDYLSRTKGARYQFEAIPYLDKDLEKKYENINFTAPPDDQVFEKLDSFQRAEVEKLSQDELKEKGHLIAEDSSNNVKVMLQNMTVKGDRNYYKFLIQNNDAVEFLTGSMQLSLYKKDEFKAKSNPYYISAFPIILPGKEFAIVYVAKDMTMDDKETLTFDLNDRLKNKRVHISIPGKVYNEEKKQKM